MTILIWACLTALSAVLYHLGGTTGYNTKFRDFGCAICAAVVLWLFGGWHWSLLLTAVLMFGALTQYWKKKGQSAKWYHWYVTGLMYGVSTLPFCFYQGLIPQFIAYTSTLAIATALWSEAFDDVVWEECGRGALLVGLLIVFLWR